jgi:hypothetical protein
MEPTGVSISNHTKVSGHHVQIYPYTYKENLQTPKLKKKSATTALNIVLALTHNQTT